MSSIIDADLLADLKSRPTNAVALFEFDLAGTTYKRAQAWAASSTGLYEGYVVDSGQITRAVSDDSFKLPRDSARVTVQDDSSRSLEKVLRGTAAGAVSGSAARIKIGSTAQAQAKWFTVFSGVIDEFSSGKPFEWSFSLRRDDRALNELVKIPYIQAYDWPDAPDDSLGLPAQVVYGTHLSTGTAFTGMVPTIYVDDVNFRYVVSFGLIADVTAVYVDGVESAAANWTFDGSFFRRGKYWSVVTFTGDQGSGVVTVDCQGITDGGVIANPATQLEHFLAQFSFNDWGGNTTSASSSWLAVSVSPIDETFFAEVETFLSDKQIAEGSRVIDATRRGIDVLNEWCNELQVASFWTYGGDLAIRADDHTDTSYVSAPHFRPEMSPQPEARSVSYRTSNLIDEVQTEYIWSEADGSFQKQITVKDSSKGYNTSQALQLHWRESDTT